LSRSHEFKKLEKIWYDKLKNEGFHDIESGREDRLLKEWSSNFFRNKFNQIKYESTVAYYDAARKILVSHKFKNAIQQKIWEMHTEGISEREIARTLKMYKKSMVHYVISQISKLIKK